MTSIAVVLSLAVPAGASSVQAEQSYIVTGPSTAAVEAALDRVGGGSEVLTELDTAAATLTASEAALLDRLPGIDVAADIPVSIAGTQNEPGWALDRLDQTEPVGGTNGATHRQYWAPDTAGSGVRVYIVDTGVNYESSDFIGRLASGYDVFSESPGWWDCHGHGTVVASTAAGTGNGAAKKVTIVPVRVLNCDGGGTAWTVLEGVNWILANHPAGTPAVVNFSLGAKDPSGTDPGAALLDAGIQALHDAGMVVVVAAGNDSTATGVSEACINTPARVPTILTVGAFDRTAIDGQTEARASFSSAGECVDGFAPGVSVPVPNSAGGTSVWSGTSFAAPLVSGLAALLLGENPSMTPAQVQSALFEHAQRGILYDGAARPLSGSSTTPNVVFLTPFDVPRPSSAPVGARVTDVTRTSVSLAWDNPSDVRIRYGTTTSAVTGATSATFTNLTAGSQYQFQLYSINEGLFSEAVTTVSATTQAADSGPTAPRNIAVTPGGYITWDAPAQTYGQTVTSYRIAWKPVDGSWTERTVAGPSGAQIPAAVAVGQDYLVAVRADTATREGAWSSFVPFVGGQPAPGPVTGLAAIAGTDRLTVSWTAPAAWFATPTGYRISWASADGRAGGATSASSPVVLTGLTAGTAHTVSVVAVTDQGDSAAMTATFSTTSAIPSEVRNLAAGTVSNGRVPLTWLAPTTAPTPVTDYRIRVSTDGGTSWSLVADSLTAATGASAPVVPGTSYVFQVVAVNAAGEGPAATVSYQAPRVPSAVTSLRVTSVTPGAVALAWTAAVSDSPVTDYVITYTANNGATWQRFADAVSAATTVTVTGLPQATQVVVAVTPVSAAGSGAAASVAGTTVNGRPSAPPSLRVTAAYRYQINIAWSAASAPWSRVSAYVIQRSSNGGRTWTTVRTVSAGTRSWAVTGLSRRTTYQIRVFAVNGYGWSLPRTVSRTTLR